MPKVMFLILMISLVAADFDPDGYLASFPTHVVVGHPTKNIMSIRGSNGIQPLEGGWFSLGSELTPDKELTVTWKDGSETCIVRDLVREDFLVHWKFGTGSDDLFIPIAEQGEVLVKFPGKLKDTLGFFPLKGYNRWYYANQFDIRTALMAGNRVKLVMEDTAHWTENYVTYTVQLRDMNLLKEEFHFETLESDDGGPLEITGLCDELEPYPQESRTLILFERMGVTSVTGLPNIVIRENGWVELDQQFIAMVDEVELILVGHETQTFKIEPRKLLLMGRHRVEALVGTKKMTVIVICGKQVYPLSPLIYTPASTPGSSMVIEGVDGSEVNQIEIRASVEGHQVEELAIEREELRHFEDMSGQTYDVYHHKYSAEGDTLFLDYQDIWEASILLVKVTYVDNGTSLVSSINVRMSRLLLNEKTTFDSAQGFPAYTLTTRVNLEKVTYLSVTSRKELSNSQLATRVVDNRDGTEVRHPLGTMSMTRTGLGSPPVFAPVRFLKGKLNEIPAGNMLRAEMTQNQGGGQPCLIDLDLRQKIYSQTNENFHVHTITAKPPLKYLRKQGLRVHFVTNDGNENHVTMRIKKWLEYHASFTIRKINELLGTRQVLAPPGDPGVTSIRADSKGFFESFMDKFSREKTTDINIYVYATSGIESDVSRVLKVYAAAHFIVLDSTATKIRGTNVFTCDILPVHGLGFDQSSLTPEQSMQQETFRGVFLGKVGMHAADLGSKKYPKRARRRVAKLRL